MNFWYQTTFMYMINYKEMQAKEPLVTNEILSSTDNSIRSAVSLEYKYYVLRMKCKI